MKAITYAQYGGSDQLTYGDVDDPKVGPDVVLVRARAAGINPVDWKVREGYLQGGFYSHLPIIPGWDVAGVVEQVGPAVTEWAPGDEVVGYVRRDDIGQGTYAELVPAPVRTLARKPSSASWAQAGGLPLAGLTALQALRSVGVEQGTGTVLVSAASGGVGHLAVQITRILGADRVIGTASERNFDFVRSLGAEPVQYGDGLADRLRELVPDGVDAAVDFAGTDSIEAFAAVTGDPKRIASVTDAQTVLGLGGRYVFVRPSAEDLDELSRWVDDRGLQVEVERTFPLADTAAAMDLVQAGHVRGKVVLDI